MIKSLLKKRRNVEAEQKPLLENAEEKIMSKKTKDNPLSLILGIICLPIVVGLFISFYNVEQKNAETYQNIQDRTEQVIIKTSNIFIENSTSELERKGTKCSLSSEGLAICFSETEYFRNKANVNENRLEIQDPLKEETWIFTGDGSCLQSGACFIKLESTSLTEALRIDLYKNPEGYIMVQK